MSEVFVRRATGISALVLTLTVFAVVPLYFVHDGAPPAANVLTRNFVTLLSCAAMLFFVSGFAHVLRRAGAEGEWLASLFQASGMLYVGLALVAASLEVGVVFGAPDGMRDPTIHGPLAEGNMLIQGPVKRLVTAIMLIAAGLGVLRTRVAPRWIGYAAFGFAAFNLCFLPSMFHGTDPTRFYSTIGWGNTAFCGSLFTWWIAAAGILVWRRSGQ